MLKLASYSEVAAAAAVAMDIAVVDTVRLLQFCNNYILRDILMSDFRFSSIFISSIFRLCKLSMLWVFARFSFSIFKSNRLLKQFHNCQSNQNLSIVSQNWMELFFFYTRIVKYREGNRCLIWFRLKFWLNQFIRFCFVPIQLAQFPTFDSNLYLNSSHNDLFIRKKSPKIFATDPFEILEYKSESNYCWHWMWEIIDL